MALALNGILITANMSGEHYVQADTTIASTSRRS